MQNTNWIQAAPPTTTTTTTTIWPFGKRFVSCNNNPKAWRVPVLSELCCSRQSNKIMPNLWEWNWEVNFNEPMNIVCSLRWWGKTRVVLGLVWNLLKRQDAQELREWMQTILVQEGETDILTTSIQELKRHFPTLERVILQERDAYMACKIYQSCRALPRRENHTMVAIVGAGHVRGMVRWLTVPSNQTPEEILSPLVTTRTGSFDEVQTLITDVT